MDSSAPESAQGAPLEPAPAGAPPDAAPRKEWRSRGRRMRHVVRAYLARPLLWLAVNVVPRIYLAYMWFVWKTSRVEDAECARFHEISTAHNGFVGMLWHEEVFSVAWAYRKMRPHTLASVGDAGEVIAKMLVICGFVVFRGGSSERKSRRRGQVLAEMIRHMQQTDDVRYGITVDGSKGPYHEIKHGALVIARECGKPLVLARTWAKRNLHLPTWDRMAIPLPFNRIRTYARGPYFVPEGADDPEVMEKFRLEMQAKLEELARESLDWSK